MKIKVEVELDTEDIISAFEPGDEITQDQLDHVVELMAADGTLEDVAREELEYHIIDNFYEYNAIYVEAEGDGDEGI